MSAYVVSQKHISVILNFGAAHNVQIYLDRDTSLECGADADLLGHILLEQNVKSVQARYPDCVDHPEDMPGLCDEVGKPYAHQVFTNFFSPVAILKACAGLRYQSCETEDYEETPAHKILRRIESEAIRALPGYDSAEWDIE